MILVYASAGEIDHHMCATTIRSALCFVKKQIINWKGNWLGVFARQTFPQRRFDIASAHLFHINGQKKLINKKLVHKKQEGSAESSV